MPTVEETVAAVLAAPTWDQRVAQLRLIPERHGTAEHQAIYAAIAERAYVPHLAPDFAYVHEVNFYEPAAFVDAYADALRLTGGFARVGVEDLVRAIHEAPHTLLVFRTIIGLLPNEFAASTELVVEMTGGARLSKSKVDSMERRGSDTSTEQARTAAETIDRIMSGALFGTPPEGLKLKQAKPDTERGWETVREWATAGVPYSLFLQQRHYGGAFGQVLNATSTSRGNLIEDAVEALFQENGVPYIRTGSHNQAEIVERFEVTITPAPDFVVFDQAGTLRGMLECKGANDGGTARDKALRFRTLRAESVRLAGVPLIAVLGGLGWTRTNDTLGPVVRDTDGRVFSVSNLDEMMTVQPFPHLRGLISPARHLRGEKP